MTTTLDEVWDLFKQVAQSQHATDLQLQETDRLMREQSQETDRRFQETDRRFQETDLPFQASVTENEKILQKLTKQIDDLIDDLGGTWGLFVENLVAPACETLFLEMRYPRPSGQPTYQKKKGGRHPRD